MVPASSKNPAGSRGGRPRRRRGWCGVCLPAGSRVAAVRGSTCTLACWQHTFILKHAFFKCNSRQQKQPGGGRRRYFWGGFAIPTTAKRPCGPVTAGFIQKKIFFLGGVSHPKDHQRPHRSSNGRFYPKKIFFGGTSHPNDHQRAPRSSNGRFYPKKIIFLWLSEKR